MIIVLSWKEWLLDLKIERANDGDLAKCQGYIDAMPDDRTAFIFDAEAPLDQQLEQLATHNGARLVELYNATLGTEDVRVMKFQDRSTALRRIGLRLVAAAREATVIKFNEEKEDMAREAKIGDFKPVGRNTHLGKIIAAYQDGMVNLDNLAVTVGLTSEQVINHLRTARGNNGINHSVTDNQVSLTIPYGVEVFKPEKEPKVSEPKAPREVKYGNFAQVRAESRLGKIIAASPATAADIGILCDLSADDVITHLKRARVSHGIDHAVAEDGMVTIFAYQMPTDTVLIKPPAEPRAPRESNGVKSAIAENATITLLVDKNPKRPTAASYALFELYRNGMTVGEFLSIGGTRAAISWDRTHGFIRTDEPQTQAAE